MFQRQIPIRHITNIPDFVWLQRSCGSMKSVSSFSSIYTKIVHAVNIINKISSNDNDTLVVILI